MLMKQKEFRKLVRSMKHLEHHWAQYKNAFRSKLGALGIELTLNLIFIAIKKRYSVQLLTFRSSNVFISPQEPTGN